MRRATAINGRSRQTIVVLLAIVALGVAGCGGDDGGSDAVSLEEVASSLEDGGYMVTDTGAGSEFTKVEPTGSRLVQGNGIPAAGFVVVEGYPTADDATAAEGEYESIETPVVAEDTLVYSAAKPADEADLDAVIEVSH